VYSTAIFLLYVDYNNDALLSCKSATTRRNDLFVTFIVITFVDLVIM
jgi:hypothetical protein